MVIICVTERNQGTPVRAARVLERIDRESVSKFIQDWVDMMGWGMVEGELNELTTGILNDGDRWWWDEMWCFQILKNGDFI